MSTDSWGTCSECEDKDVDCIPMDVHKGVQWCKTGSENRRQLPDGGEMWFATTCDYWAVLSAVHRGLL